MEPHPKEAALAGAASVRDVGTRALCSLLSRLSSHHWLLGSAHLAGIQASVSPSVLWESSIDGLEAPPAHALQVPQGCGAAADPKAPTAMGSEGQGRGWELCTLRACSQPSPTGLPLLGAQALQMLRGDQSEGFPC